MLIQTLRATVKSFPVAYKILHPAVALFYRARCNYYVPFRQGAAMERFRQFCASLPERVREPVFVKVGANDGVTGDPCSDILLRDHRWKGLLIEPVPYCFERLKVNFFDTGRFMLEQVAVGAEAGRRAFYYVDRAAAFQALPDLPSWFDQLGSFDKNHILKHLRGSLAPFIVEREMEVVALSEVLKRNGIQQVHLLHVDTEGHDFEVLKTLDFSLYLPVAIFIEHRHLPPIQRDAMLGLLRRQGYSVSDCGGDFFALRVA